MKNNMLRSILGLIFMIGLLAACAIPTIHAQSAPPAAASPAPLTLDAATGATITAASSDVIPISAQNAILGFFLHLAQSHPFVATLLSIIALSRTWAKPVSSIIHAIVDLTPSKTDDGWLNTILTWFATPAGKTVAYVIDWVTSIKIVPPGGPRGTPPSPVASPAA